MAKKKEEKMTLAKRIKAWWASLFETAKFAANLDVRAITDDSAWLLGGKRKKATIRMIREAQQRAGIR